MRVIETTTSTIIAVVITIPVTVIIATIATITPAPVTT
jgi:hypothetical protein